MKNNSRKLKVKNEQGDFQPTQETQRKTEQLYDRKKGAVFPENQPSSDIN